MPRDSPDPPRPAERGAGEGLAARGGSLPSPKRAEPARLRRCSSVKYAEYSPSSRLAAGPAAPISARSDFHHGLLRADRRHLLGRQAVALAEGREAQAEDVGDGQRHLADVVAGGGGD